MTKTNERIVSTYIALLRGINVGGNNKIYMSELKAAFEQADFSEVSTYINSGNVIFSTDETNEVVIKECCEQLIQKTFALPISVAIISAKDFHKALANAPEWWGQDPNSRHDAFVVIHPRTAPEICAMVSQLGDCKLEYEQAAYHGKIIFWSAVKETFNYTIWSKVMRNKVVHSSITVRNSNTMRKLAELTKEGV